MNIHVHHPAVSTKPQVCVERDPWKMGVFRVSPEGGICGGLWGALGGCLQARFVAWHHNRYLQTFAVHPRGL